MGYSRAVEVQVDCAYLLSWYLCCELESQIALCVYDITKR